MSWVRLFSNKQTGVLHFLQCIFFSIVKEKRELYKNLFLLAQPVCFDMYFFYKILINVLHHGNNVVIMPFYFFIFSHLTLSWRRPGLVWLLYDNGLRHERVNMMGEQHYKKYFHDENNKKMFEKKNNDRKTLTKLDPRKNHSIIAGFRILKSFNR